MILIGDYFAVLLISVLCLFYFDARCFLNTFSKYFAASLVLTATTAILDILAIELMAINGIPVVIHMIVNALYFIVNIMTTSIIALLLFSKILEHVYQVRAMLLVKIVLMVIFAFYMFFVIANFWTGWLFYFDENAVYHRGPLNAIGYVLTVFQMLLVSICYIRNRKKTTKTMQRALIQAFTLAIFCIAIQILFPDVLLNGLIMSMVNLILFMNFQNQNFGMNVLTNLHDRQRFMKHTEICLARHSRFRIYVVNIKSFDAVNQKYGHKAGDEILYLFAFALEKLFADGIAFHMNSVSFAIVLPYKTDQKHHRDDLDRLQRFLQQGIDFGAERVFLDHTIVEHALTEQCENAGVFYEELEYGIDCAKESGVSYFLFSEEIRAQMLRTRYLISRMEHIDCEHGFEVWFQPIRNMHTDRFSSMEALLRLRESDGSLISPVELIPIAEQTNMIAPITWFVIDKVCRIMAENEWLSDVCVSVNLPMPQLLEEDFTEKLNQIVDRYHLAHERLALEFTERVMLNDFDGTKAAMDRITQNGYAFYLDDFGTGFSNFNCLLQLPFQNIKLDMSLISTIDDKETDVGLVKTLTELFHKMKLSVIAEGVETEQQEQILRLYGVDRIQGYRYAAPMPLEALKQFYKEHI